MGRNRKGKRNTWQSAEMNNLQYRMYYEMLEQMACAIYRWEGLPTEIDQRFLELTLFNRGMSVFSGMTSTMLISLRWAHRLGRLTCTRIRLRISHTALTAFIVRLKSTECVPIWNNYLRRPDINAMRIYARRLADIDRTVDVNLMSQKMPIFAVVPESQPG